jgi:hypothetical protein
VPRLRTILRILAGLAVLAGLLFAGDYLVLRRHPEQFGSVEVRTFYAIKLKGKKTEYLYGEPEEQTCVHALFPQYGATPCWYLERHKEQRVDIDSGAWRLRFETP